MDVGYFNFQLVLQNFPKKFKMRSKAAARR